MLIIIQIELNLSLNKLRNIISVSLTSPVMIGLFIWLLKVLDGHGHF